MHVQAKCLRTASWLAQAPSVGDFIQPFSTPLVTYLSVASCWQSTCRLFQYGRFTIEGISAGISTQKFEVLLGTPDFNASNTEEEVYEDEAAFESVCESEDAHAVQEGRVLLSLPEPMNRFLKIDQVTGRFTACDSSMMQIIKSIRFHTAMLHSNSYAPAGGTVCVQEKSSSCSIAVRSRKTTSLAAQRARRDCDDDRRRDHRHDSDVWVRP